LDEEQRQHMLNVWQGRPLPQETRALLDRVPVAGHVRIRGSFAGRDIEEYLPDLMRDFLRARRAEVGWQPGG
jgi:hypothetical protein